jgi:predicted DNA-binding protein
MSSTRTQVYLTPEQRQRIDQLTKSRGVTLAEVVRRALDDYLDEEAPIAAPILAETFGAVPDVAPPNRDDCDRD